MDDVGSPSGRPSGLGGGRGKYACIDGDLPGAAEYLKAARTDVPAQAVAYRCRVTDNVSSSPTAGLVTKFSGLRTRSSGSWKRPGLADNIHASSMDALPDTCIMHVNIQGLRSHLAELSAVICLSDIPPDIVCINETFLDDSIGMVHLEGYDTVGRRDRSYGDDHRKCGGVIVFAISALANHVTLLHTSDESERLWFLIHAENGPYLLCSWYRPPVPGEVESIASFGKELELLRNQALGTLLIGDLNLHSQRWLHHSSPNSSEVEGEAMRKLCSELGLRQIVRGPTRGDYLLDLVITDIESASAAVSSKVADH